jgi:hypothetical protein
MAFRINCISGSSLGDVLNRTREDALKLFVKNNKQEYNTIKLDNYSMNQTSKPMDNGLNVNYENLSAEELQVREEYMQELIKARKALNPNDYALTDEEMQKRNELHFFKKLRDNEDDSAKVGDIFHTSWGYDQTNIEHFQIKEISKTGKTCKVIQIGSSTAPESEMPMADQVYPDPKVIINGTPCQVKIERSTEWNPVEKKRQEIGEIQLRGSVYYSGEEKHLQTLFRVSGKSFRSWYH